MKKLTIKDVVKQFPLEDEELLFGQFLDDFYREVDAQNRFNMIKDEPDFDETNVIFMCILAGTAEKLANDYGLEIPKWALDERYVMQNMYYAFDTKNREFQDYLMRTTPQEFKRRNLIVGDTLLERC